MPEAGDLGDIRAEREEVRAAAEAEASARAAVDRHRRLVAERRAQLEAQATAAEEELRGQKEAALELHGAAAVAKGKEGAAAVWAEAEEAAAAVRRADADLATARSRAADAEETERRALETSKAIYQLYAAGTGIRWDNESQSVAGYVAIGSQPPRPFDVGEASEKGSMATADKLWEEIEATLPPNMRPVVDGETPSVLRGGA